MRGIGAAGLIAEDQVNDMSVELRIAKFESDLGHVKKNMAQMATAVTALQAGLTVANEANMALKVDFVRATGEIRTEMAELRSEVKEGIADLRTGVKQDIADLRIELKQEIADLRIELKQDIANLQQDVDRKFVELRAEIDRKLTDLRTEITREIKDLGNRLTAAKQETHDNRIDLKQEIAVFRADLAGFKAMLSQFATKAELHAMETRIIKWFIGTAVTLTTLAFAIAKLVN